MSARMTPLPETPKDAAVRPYWRLTVLLYPFVVMAVAINLFMLGLIGTWLGFPAIAPLHALICAFLLGLPANHAATRWIIRLLNRAEAR